jgi:hypothetical protein
MAHTAASVFQAMFRRGAALALRLPRRPTQVTKQSNDNSTQQLLSIFDHHLSSVVFDWHCMSVLDP